MGASLNSPDESVSWTRTLHDQSHDAILLPVQLQRGIAKPVPIHALSRLISFATRSRFAARAAVAPAITLLFIWALAMSRAESESRESFA